MPRSFPPLALGAALRWDMVHRALPPDPGDLLEVGCGQGAFAARLCGRSRSFLAVEPDPTSFAIAKSWLPEKHVLNQAAETLPEGARFDTVCAFEVIEHLADDAAALRFWVSRLKPGGTLMVSAPAHARRLGPWDELVGHYRRYDPDQIAALLCAAGLTDVSVRLYGYPAGPLLEGARNLVARRRLRRRQHAAGFDQRTASSGRQLQPRPGFAGLISALVGPMLVGLQRLFPNRGIALLATGRVPG